MFLGPEMFPQYLEHTGLPRVNGAPLGTIMLLKLPEAPDQAPMDQGADKRSIGRALGASRAGGLLNKEPEGPLWRPWVIGPLEQAGAQDQ